MSTFQCYEIPFDAQIARFLIDDERRNGYGKSYLTGLWRREAHNAEALPLRSEDRQGDESLDDVFMAFSCDPGLDALKDKMSVAQVAEAERRVKAWQAQHPKPTK
jgi:hypothetical protein